MTIELPVGETPNWEDGEEDDLKRPAQSLLLLQSLNQSRNAWLYSMFPKFSSKGKAKQQPELNHPPPHNVRQVGKCNMRIGPHVFPETTFYEATYYKAASTSTPQPAAPNTSTYQYPSASHGLLSGSAPYSSSYSSQPAAVNLPPVPPKASTSNVHSSQLPSSDDITLDVPATLVAQVNDAAATNSTLQSLLQAAAEGSATVEQLKALGILIQSVAAKSGNMDMFPTLSASRTSSSTANRVSTVVERPVSVPGPSTKQNETQRVPERIDILFEFHETPMDRWLLPPDMISFRAHPNGAHPTLQDITLSYLVPFDAPKRDEKTDTSMEEDVNKSPTVIHLFQVGRDLFDILSKWVSDEAKSEDSQQKFKQKIKEDHSRTYLQHRLPDCHLLNQLQAAQAPYPMKPIKPSAYEESGRARRARARKLTRLQTVGENEDQTASSTASTTKRRRSSQIKKPANIICAGCGQTDVPLLMGGRYCQACIDTGRTTDPTPAQANGFRIFNPRHYTPKPTEPTPSTPADS